MKKKAKAKTKTRKKGEGLPEGWTLPALADRRKSPRPKKLTAAQRARMIAKRS